jgi:Cu+-exporting ATPase
MLTGNETGGVAVYFEAAAAITTLVLLGQVLELRAQSQPEPQSAPYSGLPQKRPESWARTARSPIYRWNR